MCTVVYVVNKQLPKVGKGIPKIIVIHIGGISGGIV